MNTASLNVTELSQAELAEMNGGEVVVSAFVAGVAIYKAAN